MDFTSGANWIWQQGEVSPRNFWLRVRRAFRLEAAEVRRASLLITADSRYELFVNGEDVGNGPVRSFPWAYSYDEYDVTGWLRAGEENVLAARVVHWGDQTFQYIRGRGGLLCELVLEYADGYSERISSDASWLVAADPVFERHAPRISIQQGFEEQYDARQEDGWHLPGYQEDGWQAATIVGPVGTAPWQELIPRSIPFLTRDVVLPSKVLAAEIAQLRPGYRWSFDLRHRVRDLTQGVRGDALGTRGLAFATEIVAERACRVGLANASNADYEGRGMSCNGQPLAGELELHAGRNLFVIAGTEWPALSFQTDEQLTFEASRLLAIGSTENEAVWAYLGPFDERNDNYSQLLAASSPEQLPAVPRVAIAATENMEDITLVTRAQHFILPTEGFCAASIAIPQPREQLERTDTPLVESVSALLHQDANYTLLYPQQEGDVHLIIDFGRELVGFPVLELDAPEGTIVDANLFEGIDASGIFWTDMLRNSFRYTCRAGHQTFRSHQRRGYRYASLTFRFPAFTSTPIKLYNVRTLLNTYPVERRGSFACSDALLSNIWDVAAYTVQLCMEDTYVDCPAYEQVFWVGDARNSALINAVTFGAYELTTRCLLLTDQSLSRKLDSIKPPHLSRRAHLTTDHVASGWFSEIPMWTFLWIWNVQEHYHITGDRAILAQLYPALRECLQRCLAFLSPRGLLNLPDVWNLVDWSAMDLTRDGEVTSSNALLVESLRRAASLAEILAATNSEQEAELRSDAVSYRDNAERIYQAINAYCWSEERGAYVDTVRDEQGYAYHQALAAEYGTALDSRESFLQRTRISEHTNTLVLLCHCVPSERIERVLPLVEAAQQGNFIGSSPAEASKFPADQVVPVGSPWFLFFTAETLFDYQKLDTVITLMRDQWGRMLEKGATTFWETFPNLNSPHWSRSLCHGWSAAPAYFLSTQVLGIQPSEPGYQRVRIAPQTSGLQWARGTVPTPHGDIQVSWTQQDSAFQIEVILPANITGELTLQNTTQPLNPGLNRITHTRKEHGI
ncbi:family 78 glycoside hydrolase catalytic domain [Dictyobacter kobayashii]|uniref:Uncharacterized protein n=1 Tax=Dictyobacter kobayashii TaxID=2014872 RepID=A0A402ALC4_9CHLR|nr:family 78 glycoside hydrolase catalytic domain [Dictyobacter kobayashii]GCE19835.1 hypothetical protein KDK_36350 [Dictyobacter kobayashii]